MLPLAVTTAVTLVLSMKSLPSSSTVALTGRPLFWLTVAWSLGEVMVTSTFPFGVVPPVPPLPPPPVGWR